MATRRGQGGDATGLLGHGAGAEHSAVGRWVVVAPRRRHDARMGYYDHGDRDDVLSGGIRMLPIETAAGTFRVWTKRTGNNPALKVLLLHGGPGATH